MNVLNFIKPITDRLSKMVPEARFKDPLRALFYNAFNPDCKMKVLGNGEFLIQVRGTSFRVAHVPAFEIGNDLIALRGYLHGLTLAPGSVVVDAGASGSGIATMCLSRMVGDTGRVLALEPDKKSLETLEKNLRLNNIKNVTTLNQGLWNREETLTFNSGMGQSSSVAFANGESGAGTIKLNCIDLDQLLKNLKIPKVDFIKMDIEGAEIEALEGMKNLLQAGGLGLAIASYHYRDGKQTYLALENTFRQLGYEVHTGHPIHLTTYARKA